MVGEKMCSCLRGLDAEDKMRGMAAHSRLRAHGLIRDNGSYLMHRYHIVWLKNGDNSKPWMDLMERFESMMGRED